MTDAPRRVLAFLIGIDLAGYSRSRLAGATKLPLRTINRALSKLVEIGAIERQRGGRGTPSKIRVIMSMEEFMAHQVKMAHQVAKSGPLNAKSGPLSGALNLKELSKEESRQARKPMGVEIPPEYIALESGRQVINPAWKRVRDRLRAAHQDGRLHGARDRGAYIAAIIRRETERSA